MSATRYTRNVLFYEGPTTVNFHPTIFVDVGEVIDSKVAALEAHSSQVGKTNIEDLPITTIATSMANFRGTQARTGYAEGFAPVRLFINL
jgi:LmbE family N-acetylglucosaminyl deacetylase